MFIPVDNLDEQRRFVPEFTVISVPSFQGAPEIDGTNAPTFIVLSFEQRMVHHRRHRLRRRDQEVGLHHPELPAAAARAS